jgi:hypothetical protein
MNDKQKELYETLTESPPAGKNGVIATPYWYGRDNPDLSRPAWVNPRSAQYAAWRAGRDAGRAKR